MRWLIVVPLVALLAACGGSGAKGGQSSGDDGAAVAAAIRQAVTSTDPADCTRLQTQRFVDQSQLVKGAAALKRCRDDAKDPRGNPRTTTVSAIKIDGDVARARAAFEGGDLDGQAIDLRVVKHRDRWKLDHIEGFAKFDRKRFLAALGASLRRPPDSLPQGAVTCIVGRIGGLSDAAIESIYVNADSGRLAGVFGPCFGSVIRDGLRRQGIPRALTDCVVRAIDKPPYTAVRRILEGADADQLFQGIAQSCLKNQLS
jgi:hypothetical protein